METLNCQSNESTRATAIKNTHFVEANVVNISAKFQLHPPTASEEMIFKYFFTNLAKFSSLDKIHMLHRGQLKEHFCRTFVKISTVR